MVRRGKEGLGMVGLGKAWHGEARVLKFLLTVSLLRAYNFFIETVRADSGLRRDAGRGVLVLGQQQPECLHVARHGAVLTDRDNTRAFYLPEHIETVRRCLMAQIEENALDLINEAEAIVSFLHEATDAFLTHTLKLSTNLYEKTPFGMHLVFCSVENRIEKALMMLEEGGK